MRPGGLIVGSVEPSSPLAGCLEQGDRLKALNGTPVQDVIDYLYLGSGDKLVLEAEKPDGRRISLCVEVPPEGLGLAFSDSGIFPVRRCANSCVFCFVDQMPPGLRKTLYIKDDDYRHSFLYGNFITLTNIADSDWQRILSLALSPLYISIHSTEPEIRRRILGSRRSGNVMEQLRQLAQRKITIHAQVVLVPGLNDKKHLDRTITDLAALWPAVQSVAVVPVGLSGYREALPLLEGFSPDQAKQVIEQVGGHHLDFRCRLGRGLVYASDEFFIVAGRALPPASYYDDFPQLENGVGSSRVFQDEFIESLAELKVVPGSRGRVNKQRRAWLVTGRLAEGLLGEMVAQFFIAIGEVVPLVEVIAVDNHFFGPGVTVAGLLTGRDLQNHLQLLLENTSRPWRPEVVLLPGVLMQEGENHFLDSVSVSELQARLNLRVQVVPSRGRELAGALADISGFC